MAKRIGFVLNPIAGMGGAVGLKGTDGVVAEAVKRGATPVSPGRAAKALMRLRQLRAEAADPPEIVWLAAAGAMGEDALGAAGFTPFQIVHTPASKSGRDDTIAATRAFLAAGVDLILFCGGDGTARDIAGLAGSTTPVLGIPAGVKMFSGVFGTTPEHAADILHDWSAGRIGVADVEVLDLDEEKYRAGEWAVRRYHHARTPFAAEFVQAAKSIAHGADEATAKEDIAAFVVEEYAVPGRLLILGAGTTVEAVGRALGIEKTLLGIDAVADGREVGRDLDAKGLRGLLARYPDRRLVLSPIGAQGFVLGRGTLQIGPDAVREIGTENIVVVATPAKIAETPVLRFDTGDPALDAALCGDGYLPVITGYRFRRRVKAAH